MNVPENPSGNWLFGLDPFDRPSQVFGGYVGAETDSHPVVSRRIGFCVRETEPQAPDDPDAWYAAEVERMRERAPA